MKVAELDGKTPDETTQIEAPQNAAHRVPGHREVYENDFYTTVLTGYINIPEDGVYYFSTDHEMWLDGNLFISNVNDNHETAHRFSRSDRSVALAKGYHPVKLIRLGAIFRGWPNQWETMRLQIRKADEPQFKTMDKNYFL
ncbi:MAG: hypothetical protein LIO65_05825 [Odoribacter sp.]|nr:hypothetical protein [Odoribacter sp.]